jgi:hypothetical protein
MTQTQTNQPQGLQNLMNSALEMRQYLGTKLLQIENELNTAGALKLTGMHFVVFRDTLLAIDKADTPQGYKIEGGYMPQYFTHQEAKDISAIVKNGNGENPEPMLAMYFFEAAIMKIEQEILFWNNHIKMLENSLV